MTSASNEHFLWKEHPVTEPMAVEWDGMNYQWTDGICDKGQPSYETADHPHSQDWKLQTTIGMQRVPRSESLFCEEYVFGLSSHKWEERLEAIRTLEVVGLKACLKAGDVLQRAVMDEEESVRVAAVELLGNLGEYAPVVTLLEALYDSYWDVRA